MPTGIYKRTEYHRNKIRLSHPKGNLSPLWKDFVGRLPSCVDCGKKLSRMDAIRCRTHSGKSIWNKRKKSNIKIICLTCNKAFNIFPYESISGVRKTCSRECFKKYNSIKNSGNKHWLYGKHHKKKSLIKMSLSRKGRFGGRNHPNWINGKSFEPYGIEFNDELKNKIKVRDNFVCQNCGITEEEHIMVFGVVLTIHHIDYNKRNNKEENLITVCRSCNSRANFNRELWKNKFLAIELLVNKIKVQ